MQTMTHLVKTSTAETGRMRSAFLKNLLQRNDIFSLKTQIKIFEKLRAIDTKTLSGQLNAKCSSWQLDQVLGCCLPLGQQSFCSALFLPTPSNPDRDLSSGGRPIARERYAKASPSVSLILPCSLALSNRRESAVIEESYCSSTYNRRPGWKR